MKLSQVGVDSNIAQICPYSQKTLTNSEIMSSSSTGTYVLCTGIYVFRNWKSNLFDLGIFVIVMELLLSVAQELHHCFNPMALIFITCIQSGLLLYLYRLLNKYSVLGSSSLVGIWSPSLRDDQSDQRTRSQNTVCEFNNRIIIYLYKIINFIQFHHIYVGLLIIIKCF